MHAKRATISIPMSHAAKMIIGQCQFQAAGGGFVMVAEDSRGGETAACPRDAFSGSLTGNETAGRSEGAAATVGVSLRMC